MKLLYIHSSIAVFGGIERVLVDKMNYFANLPDFEVFLVTFDQGSHSLSFPLDPKIQYTDLGIRFHQQYSLKWPQRLIKKIQLYKQFNQRLKNAICSISPNIIIGTEWTPAIPILINKKNIPYVLESHFGYATVKSIKKAHLFRKISLYLEYKAFSRADLVVSLTNGDFSLWQKRHVKNIRVIPNVVHVYDGKNVSKQTEKKVIFAGRLTEEKDVFSLMKIWEQVYARHKDWELNIFGDGELKSEIEKIISDKNINIQLHTPTRNIFSEFCKSSILVLTSQNESFGLVLVEAMSCGLPVVSFDCPFGPRDIINNGKNGFLISNRNIEVFADKLSILIENQELRVGMGKNAIISSQNYRPENIMPIWRGIFETLTK